MAGLLLQNVQDIQSWKVSTTKHLVLRLFTFVAVPNPLGVVAVLSAFNFPVAVYGWYAHLLCSVPVA